MSLPISNTVDVKITSTPPFTSASGLGNLLIIGDSLALDTCNPLKFYGSMDEVAEDFLSIAPEYGAAQLYFEQNPKPDLLAIGRWLRDPSGYKAQLRCGEMEAGDLQRLQSVHNGGFNVETNEGLIDISSLDFSSASSFETAAEIISLSMQRREVDSLCRFVDQRFVLYSPGFGESARINFTTPPAQGEDIGPIIRSTKSTQAQCINGISAQIEPGDALTYLEFVNPQWYGVSFALSSPLTDDQTISAARWCEARLKIFGYTTDDRDILNENIKSDIASRLKDLGMRRTFGLYNPLTPSADVSVFSRAFAVDLDQPNSSITLKFKVLPGVSVVSVTQNDVRILREKNINFYTLFGKNPMFAEGVMASGNFFDEVQGLDWFQRTLEENVFSFLYQTPKVPQSDKGVAQIVQQIEKGCASAVLSGLLSPGVWTGKGVGHIRSGDYLPRGFYVYATPLSRQSVQERSERKAPPIYILAKGSGAVHFVDILVEFER